MPTPPPCTYCDGKGHYSVWSAGGDFGDSFDGRIRIKGEIKYFPCKKCKGSGQPIPLDVVGEFVPADQEINPFRPPAPEEKLERKSVRELLEKMGEPIPPSEQSRVRSSKQSEECYVDSRTPEEKANEPSATVTSAGGPMTVALTPPKAEGATVSQDQTVKESLTVTPQHISKMETTKAEGVGEWDDITVDTVSLKKMISTTIEVLSHKDAAEQVWSDVCKALTSATRVAEERKDGEIRGIVDAAHKLSKVLWDTMPFFTKEVGDADLELRRLLPPPPDKPTQP